MSLTEIPAVAKSFSTFCKKCDAERYHKVLAHTSTNSAKIECEICHSKKTFKLGAPSKVKTGVKGDKAVKEKKPSARSIKKEQMAEAMTKAHLEEYDKLMTELSDQNESKYNMGTKFLVNAKLRHPKFGVGIVKSIFDSKIEVIFPDEIRYLVHNRGV